MNHGLFDSRFKLSNIPERYRDPLSLNVYALYKVSDQKNTTPEIMQLVQQKFKNIDARLSFPNEIIFKILDYSIKSCCLIRPNLQLVQNFNELKKNALLFVLKAPIVDFSMKAYIAKRRRQNQYNIGTSIEEISSLEPHNSELYESDLAIRITTTEKEVSNTDIENLKKSGLIYFKKIPRLLDQACFNIKFQLTNEKREQYDPETGKNTFSFSLETMDGMERVAYNFYKTFNAHSQYSLAFSNRYADYNPHDLVKDTQKCHLTVFDREINKKVMSHFFDDYIQTCFCSGGLLFVELMQKRIVRSYHCPETVFQANHRIEVYNVTIAEKVSVLPLRLSKKKDGNKKLRCPIFELAYVDDQKIYLRRLKDGVVVSMNYYHQITEYPLDEFFVDDLKDENKISHVSRGVIPIVSNQENVAPHLEVGLSNQDNVEPVRQHSISFLSRVKNCLAQLFYLSLKLFFLFKSIA